MRTLIITLLVLFCFTATAEARRRVIRKRRSARKAVYAVETATQKGPQATATQKATQKAAWSNKGHIGGSFGGANYEGVGFSTYSAAAALNSCCYTGQRKLAGSAVVRGRDGWYAVKLFW